MAKYKGFKAECQGFSHKKVSPTIPCQDAVGFDDEDENFAICAAADGHGSEKYLRSKEGADFAVSIAIEAVKDFIAKDGHVSLAKEGSAEKDRKKLLEGLAAHIVSRWIDKTRGHWEEGKSLTDNEKTLFGKHYPSQDPSSKELNIAKIYGTTLIVGAITEKCAFIIQCGDGAACVIAQGGETKIPPETVDENQLGSLTNSISSSDCLTLFRFFYTTEIPKAMVLASDGVLESYGGNDGNDFLRFCEKVVELHSADYEQAQRSLDEWLPKLSEKGSEDDMSMVGIFLRPEAKPDAGGISAGDARSPGGEANGAVTEQRPEFTGIAGAASKPDSAPTGFVRVEGGTFQMGSLSGGKDNERPVRSVTVSSFFMCKHPVTQGEWRDVMGNNLSPLNGDSFPAESVSWFDAVEHANRRSAKEGLILAYAISGAGNDRSVVWNRGANGYRLPTEAEWEYAARGGNGSPGNFEYSGSNDASEVAWHKDNSESKTHEVGKLKPNGLGVYDMSGNIWEWCWDWHSASYPSDPETDPAGASSGYARMLRGGSWANGAQDARCASRNCSTALGRTRYGFRLVRSLIEGRRE